MASNAKTVNVDFPGRMAKLIERQPWFKYYEDLPEFLVEAARDYLFKKL